MDEAGIQVKVTGKLGSFLGQFSQKYTYAANAAARKAAFIIYGICQKDYLSVSDGESRRTAKVRPTLRSTYLGLRRPTGTLAKNVKVGVYEGSNLTILNSENGAISKTKILDGAAVGIGDEIKYGVIQERGGRDKIMRKDGGYKFHPFLAPAFEDAKQEIKQIFDAEFKAAEKKFTKDML